MLVVPLLAVPLLGSGRACGDSALGPYELCWSIYQRESVLAGYECDVIGCAIQVKQADLAQRLLR